MPISGAPLDKQIQIVDLLQRGVETKPDELALVSLETRWTWRELEDASTRLAANLLGLGLKPGDRVASLMPNRPVLVVHYLACIKAGLVATPLNYRYMPPEIDHALKVSGASIMLAHAERDGDVAGSKRTHDLPLGVILYGAGNERTPMLEDLLAQEPGPIDLPAPDPASPAFIFFTSGSTGLPKGVTHSFESFGWITASTIKALGLTNDDSFLAASSLSHEGGVGFSFSALAAGARVMIGRTSDPDELLPLLRGQRPTVIWMLPAALIRLVRDHGAKAADFSSLRVCSSGGDKASAELEREFADLTGFPIAELYGMTEFGCATLTPPSGINKPGSVGPLCPGYRLSIRDTDGKELPNGAEGRLWIQSPSTMIGYWDRPDATAETVKDGWLDTGDVMKVDEDGYLWFCGRKKQIIVHDGSNICPQEVEGALLEHPSVASAGVVGVHDLMHGENVYAYITLDDGADPPTSQELVQFARIRVGYKAPEHVDILEEMPLNPAGKIDRTALKRMAAVRTSGTALA